LIPTFRIWVLAALLLPGLMELCGAADLTPRTLGVIFNEDEPESRTTALFYASLRAVPMDNVVGIHLPLTDTIAPAAFASVRDDALARLPTSVQSLLLIWSRPYAVGCMSVTTAFAAGYRPEFCEPGCGLTAPNPLYDSDDWLPADTVGWWPAMLLPTSDPPLARAVIERGVEADHATQPGTFYLVITSDAARNVRSADYIEAQVLAGKRTHVQILTEPVSGPVNDAIGYFTGRAQVAELEQISFLPGAAADHLTSAGGILYGVDQMSALKWLMQGATGSYGAVSEPCNHPEKFPRPSVFIDHYLRGEPLLEAYWKSVAMPGQGLFIGEPLARPSGWHPLLSTPGDAASVTGLQQNTRM
jgi:uncharacterized protein (TIGR03790 family)